MRPDPKTIGTALTMRLDLEALYLCGPFDTSGEPASPDIHVLAISRDDLVRDLHFVPGVSGFERRVEVSVAPLSVLRRAVEEGISSWFMFYTVDKIRGGKPVLESAGAGTLRDKALRNLRMRPSFYAEAVRSVVWSGGHPTDLYADAGTGVTPRGGQRDPAHADGVLGGAPRATGEDRPDAAGTMRALALNGRFLSLLALHAVVKSRRTFSRYSDLLAEGSSFPAPLARHGRAEALGTLGATEHLVERLFTRLGIDPRRLTAAPGWTDSRGAAH